MMFKPLIDKISYMAAAAVLFGAAPAAAQSFTMVAVGDLIISRPLSQLQQPGAFAGAPAFRDALAILARADVTYGNLETTIYDIREFDGYPFSWDGDWTLTSVPAVAEDLEKMGFDIFSRANNHALDWGIEGMRQTTKWIDEYQLVHAGVGENLAQATQPAYFKSAKGPVGIVSMVTTYRPTSEALPVGADAPLGRPGANALALQTTSVVDGASYSLAVTLACSFAGSSPCPPFPLPSSVDLFGTIIRPSAPGETPFTYSYTMNQADLKRITDAIATAKKNARYVIATTHSHEPWSDEDPPITWAEPGLFLRTLARTAIDNGADAFVTTGIHHVAGLEIYKGKPIFYGLGNFFWSDMQEPLSSDLYESIDNQASLDDAFTHPERATDADLTALLNAQSFATPGSDKTLNRTFQTVIAENVYDDGTGLIKEIRLYPIDLGYGETLTSSGVPRRASATIANRILDRITELSDADNVQITRTTEGGYVIGIVTPR